MLKNNNVMSEITKESLIKEQIECVELTQNKYDNAPFHLKGILKDILTIQKRILHRLGHSHNAQAQAKKEPKKGFFKRPTKNDGELEVDPKGSGIDNKVKKGFFKAKDLDESVDASVIDNNVKKGMFTPPELSDKPEEKANPKRLNQEQIGNIKKLANDGFNPVQISDKLMIVQSKVGGVLAKMKKGVGNLLASSNKKGNSLENEIKDNQ